MEYVIKYKKSIPARNVYSQQSEMEMTFDEGQVLNLKAAAKRSINKYDHYIDDDRYSSSIYKYVYDHASFFERLMEFDGNDYPVEVFDFEIPKCLINEAKYEVGFLDWCEETHEFENIQEYTNRLREWLMICSWHYSEESANKLIATNMQRIVDGYVNSRTIGDVGIDVGYACG